MSDFKILSIDGGGFRGVFSAHILKRIEDEFNIEWKKPGELIKKELVDLREKNKLSRDLIFRDPYVLDFLNFKDTFSEKDLEKNEMESNEDLPLGLILYAEGSHETIKLLQLDNSGIHVAEYLTELPPRELLMKKLHSAMELAKARLEGSGMFDE